MNNYDTNNILKTAINTFIDSLSKDKKTELKKLKKLKIPEIPKDHNDLNYTNEKLEGFQLFRYKIYLLLFKTIEVNLDNFKKINNLSYYKLNTLFRLKPIIIEKLFLLEKKIFYRLLKLNIHDIQLTKLLDLELDIDNLNKFIDLNLSKDITNCPELKCDYSPEIINWVDKKDKFINLLSYDVPTIRKAIQEVLNTKLADFTEFNRLTSKSTPNPKMK
jgi:hypothetical protein